MAKCNVTRAAPSIGNCGTIDCGYFFVIIIVASTDTESKTTLITEVCFALVLPNLRVQRSHWVQPFNSWLSKHFSFIFFFNGIEIQGGFQGQFFISISPNGS